MIGSWIVSRREVRCEQSCHLSAPGVQVAQRQLCGVLQPAVPHVQAQQRSRVARTARHAGACVLNLAQQAPLSAADTPHAQAILASLVAAHHMDRDQAGMPARITTAS